MSIETTISKITGELISVFASLDSWFDRDEKFLRSRPPDKWSPAEVLEHIMLTNHYLLILIGKGGDRARKLADGKNLESIEKEYRFNHAALDEIAVSGTFPWPRPDHMEPAGLRSLIEIRLELRDQLYRNLCQLDNLSRGEGGLHLTTMSVNSLGKLDVYQYIYFLAQHAKRHLYQLKQAEDLHHQDVTKA